MRTGKGQEADLSGPWIRWSGRPDLNWQWRSSAQSRPTTFRFRNEQYAVEHAYGHWSADGGWWTEEQWIFKHWDLAGRAQDLMDSVWLMTKLWTFQRYGT